MLQNWREPRFCDEMVSDLLTSMLAWDNKQVFWDLGTDRIIHQRTKDLQHGGSAALLRIKWSKNLVSVRARQLVPTLVQHGGKWSGDGSPALAWTSFF